MSNCYIVIFEADIVDMFVLYLCSKFQVASICACSYYLYSKNRIFTLLFYIPPPPKKSTLKIVHIF
jgi:hypothetical protein